MIFRQIHFTQEIFVYQSGIGMMFTVNGIKIGNVENVNILER